MNEQELKPNANAQDQAKPTSSVEAANAPEQATGAAPVVLGSPTDNGTLERLKSLEDEIALLRAKLAEKEAIETDEGEANEVETDEVKFKKINI